MLWKKFLIGLLILFTQQVSLIVPAIAESIIASERVEKKSLCVDELNLAITEIINSREFEKAHFGILIENLNSGDIIYAWNENKYFIPASNVKLLTTASALRELGVNYTLQTKVYTTGAIPSLDTLRIRGVGDPTLTTQDLEKLAQDLQELGVREISRLMVDDGYLTNTEINPTWEWEDVYASYGVSVSSLILDQNEVILTITPSILDESVIIDWSNDIAGKQWLVENLAVTTVGDDFNTITVEGVLGEPMLKIKGKLGRENEPDIWGLAIRQPSLYFLESVKQALLNEGITVREAVIVTEKSDFSLAGETELIAIASPSVGDLVTTTNLESNNLFAEMFVSLLGKKFEPDSGIETIEDSLSGLGVDNDGFRIVDGSGLSRHNLVTPKALVETLTLMRETPEGMIYIESLPVGGVSGTLTRRFVDTSVAGFVRAKTGTLSGVSSLSGYLELPDNEPMVFSILVNQSLQSHSFIRQGIDEIVLLLSRINLRC